MSFKTSLNWIKTQIMKNSIMASADVINSSIDFFSAKPSMKFLELVRTVSNQYLGPIKEHRYGAGTSLG